MGVLFNRIRNKGRRRYLRNNATLAEKLLWLRLKGRQIEGYKFRRQFGIASFIVDFYCPELRLVIEADGLIHDTPSAKLYDARRQRKIESLGIRFLRFRNQEILDSGEEVAEKIQAVVRELKKRV